MAIPPDLEHAVEFEILYRLQLDTPGFDPHGELRLTARGLAVLIARAVAVGLAKAQSGAGDAG